jgi:hypothetical protein
MSIKLSTLIPQATGNTVVTYIANYTTVNRDAISPSVDGMLVYNTTDHKLQVRANGVWANCN